MFYTLTLMTEEKKTKHNIHSSNIYIAHTHQLHTDKQTPVHSSP